MKKQPFLEYYPILRILPNTTNTTEFTSAVDSRFIEAFDFALHRQVQSYLKKRANVLKNGPGST